MNIPMSAEEAGVVIDALIEHAASARQRKDGNPESTSDLRGCMCDDLINRIAHAGGAPSWSEFRGITP